MKPYSGCFGPQTVTKLDWDVQHLTWSSFGILGSPIKHFPTVCTEKFAQGKQDSFQTTEKRYMTMFMQTVTRQFYITKKNWGQISFPDDPN